MQDVTPNLLLDAANSLYHKTAAMIAAARSWTVHCDCGRRRHFRGAGGEVGSRRSEAPGDSAPTIRPIQGFMTKSDSVYTLTASSAAFLDKRSPAYLGSATDFLASAEMRTMVFADPVGVVRSGGSLGLGTLGPGDPIWIRFARALAPLVTPTARAVADFVAAWPIPPEKVLDVSAKYTDALWNFNRDRDA